MALPPLQVPRFHGTTQQDLDEWVSGLNDVLRTLQQAVDGNTLGTADVDLQNHALINVSTIRGLHGATARILPPGTQLPADVGPITAPGADTVNRAALETAVNAVAQRLSTLTAVVRSLVIG